MSLPKLGNVVATPGAMQLCEVHAVNPLLLLGRHCSGDWGNLDASDVATNVHTVQHDLRILSSYAVGSAKVWVITEADRNFTCLLLPDEY